MLRKLRRRAIVLTCKQVPEVLMKEDLKWGARAQLSFHLFICVRCRALKKQFERIHTALHRHIKQAPKLDPDLASKIIEKKFKNVEP